MRTSKQLLTPEPDTALTFSRGYNLCQPGDFWGRYVSDLYFPGEHTFVPKKMKITLKQVELTYICVALQMLRTSEYQVPGYDTDFIDNLIKSLERRRKQTRRVA